MIYYHIPKGTICQFSLHDSNGSRVVNSHYKTRRDKVFNSNDVDDIYDAIDDTDPSDVSFVLFRDGKLSIDNEEMDKILVVEKGYMRLTHMGLIDVSN